MRHGDAVPAGFGDDEARTLSEHGQQQAESTARAMRRAGFLPEQIWHSPYVRACETASAVAAHFPAARCEVSQGWVPHGRAPSVVADLLDRAPDRLLVVSHLPLLPDVVTELLALSLRLDFSTASLAHFVLPPARSSRLRSALVGFYRGEVLTHWGAHTDATPDGTTE